MVFNKIFARIESLVDSNETVEDSIPCKSDILSLRECRKGDKSVSFAWGVLSVNRFGWIVWKSFSLYLFVAFTEMQRPRLGLVELYG